MAYLLMDIGGNYIKSGWIGDHPEDFEVFDPIPTPQNKNSLVSAFEVQVANILSKKEDCQGIGLSHAGIVDDARGISVFNGSLPFMKGFDYRTFVHDKFQLSLHIINDGQAACLAEARQGALQGVKIGASLTLGTGLGLGLIVGGDIYQGARGVAGEVSFILPDYEGLPLVRSSGVFELVRPANEKLASEDINDARPVFAAIKSGNYPEIEDMFIAYLKNIATLIYNLHIILDLELIAIGGGISSEPLVIERLREIYQEMYTHHPSFVFQENIFKPTEITVCQMNNNANLLGAYYFFKEQE